MIVLDIDGVVGNSYMELNLQLKKQGHEVTSHDSWEDYKFKDIYPDIPAEEIDEIMTDPLFAKNCVPYEDTWYFINYYSSYHKIILLTARPNVLESATWAWCMDWDIPVDDIIFDKDKITHLKQLEPVVYVDDMWKTVDNCLIAGIPAYLHTRSYNMKFEMGLNRIDNLWDLREYL